VNNESRFIKPNNRVERYPTTWYRSD